ncbi:MAG: hypothetical protein BMS9Abin05_1283 [Rhodothermia bacterium]|nr:MAG: hypothetical protein BMS9Abin05_1283 [Rhodothermia bacterium]
MGKFEVNEINCGSHRRLNFSLNSSILNLEHEHSESEFNQYYRIDLSFALQMTAKK